MNTATKAAITVLGSIVLLISAVKFTAAFPQTASSAIAEESLDYSSYEFSQGSLKKTAQGNLFGEMSPEVTKHRHTDYAKKTGRTLAKSIHLEYTVGNDNLIISRYTTPDEDNPDSVDEQPYTSRPRYVYWDDNGKSFYSISAKSNMSKEQVLEILEEAARK
ncbi:hypothetical protein ACM1RC_12430 [Paenibacillus azoreducens]|uniref:hypothetical protein n=1 Tax=Paenibacillus azoreducens TaxID=116718 RepID=UPI0039F4A38E